MSNRRRNVVAAAAVLGPTLVGGIVAGPAQAQPLDLWSSYNSLPACEQAAPLLVDFCFESTDGQVLGLTDPLLAVDELDQALGISGNDVTNIPFTKPVKGFQAASAVNPVKKKSKPKPVPKLAQVYDPQAETIFVGSGGAGQEAADEASGNYYYVAEPAGVKPQPKKGVPLQKPWVSVQSSKPADGKPTPLTNPKTGEQVLPPKGAY